MPYEPGRVCGKILDRDIGASKTFLTNIPTGVRRDVCQNARFCVTITPIFM